MGEIIPQVLNGTTNGLHKAKRKLWTHPDPESTRMAEFKRGVNQRYGLKLKNYDYLYKWSIDDIGSFWGEVWDFTGITASKHYDKVHKSSRDQYRPMDFSC
jgi:acetoacetyl-CoA synthetase